MKRNKPYLLLAFAALAVFLFLPAPSSDLDYPAAEPAVKRQPLFIEAKAALAQDFVSGEVLFSKNAQAPLPLASLTKIISGLVVLDYFGLAEEVGVSKEAVSAPEPSSLRAGEHFKVRDLLAMAIVESSNDAIAALAEHVIQKNSADYGWFLDLMKKKAEALGAGGMNFYNISGLDISEDTPGAYGSAEGLLVVVGASLSSPLWGLGETMEVTSREGIKHALKPTNDLAPELTPLVGSKTGYTDLAGGNLLVIIEYPIGRPLGIVVLGSTEQGRFEDAKKILEWVKTQKTP